jgi:prephenate dehydratase
LATRPRRRPQRRACDRLFGDTAELVALPSFAAVTEATADRTIDVGVLPIESSLAGPVAETHDLLYDSPLAITGETVLPIRHFLVGPEEVSLDRIRAVHSHPVALDQCRRLLATMPNATAIAAATTGRRSSRRCRARRPDRGGDRERTRGAAAWVDGDRRGHRRSPGSVHPLRLGLPRTCGST